MAQVRSRPKKGPLKPVASVADGMLTDSSANVALTPYFQIKEVESWLVVWNMNFMTFRNSWEFHHPN